MPNATAASLDEGLAKKLHPRNFASMSPKMTAIVAYILGIQDGWTTPQILEIIVTVDSAVLARTTGHLGFDEHLAAEEDLARNWENLLDAAGLTPEERQHASRLYEKRIKQANRIGETR